MGNLHQGLQKQTIHHDSEAVRLHEKVVRWIQSSLCRTDIRIRRKEKQWDKMVKKLQYHRNDHFRSVSVIKLILLRSSSIFARSSFLGEPILRRSRKIFKKVLLQKPIENDRFCNSLNITAHCKYIKFSRNMAMLSLWEL